MADWKQYKNGCYEINCTNIEDLQNIIEDHVSKIPEYIYRGQSKEEYKLISTLDRFLNKYYEESKINRVMQIKYRNFYIKKHLQGFRKLIRGHVDSDEYFTNDLFTWTLGQHYGLYTPYLDWTDKPYIALFFAALENHENDCCLYCLNRNYINILNEFVREFPPKKYIETYKLDEEDKKYLGIDFKCETNELRIIDPMTNNNKRLSAQLGCFTKTPHGESIEEWIDLITEDYDNHKSGKFLLKIKIDANLKKDILKFLDNANINYSSIYPDLEGISKYCNYVVENNFDNLFNSMYPFCVRKS